MTHLYIELNTGLTEEVDIKVIEKLYDTVTNNTLDETSDLKGRLHTPSAKDSHISYLTTRFPELYITADIQYIAFADPYIENYMKNYIGDGTGTILAYILSFISSGRIFGDNYNNPRLGNSRTWALTYNLKILPTTFNEFGTLFEGITKVAGFNDFRNLTSITIPSTVTEIGTNAFSNTSALTSLNLNFENILSIGASAFANSHIGGGISLPNLTYIAGSAFRNTLITSISLSAITALQGDGTFSGCSNLTTVTGLSSLTIIPPSTFYKCTLLSNIDLDFSIITEIGLSAFQDCTSLSFPSPSAFPSLNTLGKNAFSETSILQITNLGNITKIPSDCFRDCAQLTSVQLPNTVTTIENYAFQRCTNLTTVTGLSNVTTLDTACFLGCSNLLTIDIDNSKITVLGGICFYGCSNLSNLVTVNFPNLLTMGTSYSARQQFRDCSLILHVVNLGSITEIGDTYGQGTFDNCTNLQTVTLPETLQTLRYSGLTRCPNIRWVKLLSTSVPFYNTTDGFGSTSPTGKFFGESFRNQDVSNEYLGSTYPIYVKDELVNDYKSANGFSPIAFRIRPLSLFATDFPNG